MWVEKLEQHKTQKCCCVCKFRGLDTSRNPVFSMDLPPFIRDVRVQEPITHNAVLKPTALGKKQPITNRQQRQTRVAF